MNDDTPITWGHLKRAVENAERKAAMYSDSNDPYEEIGQDTARLALAHLLGALEDERSNAELAEVVAATPPR